MSYTIERLEQPPVYLVTLASDFSLGTEMKQYFIEMNGRLDKETKPIDIILNLLEYKVSFDGLASTTRDIMRLEANPYQNENSNKLIIVTQNKMVKLSIDGFIKFGIAKKVDVVTSIEEALRRVHLF
ncbi:MAG: hypothetical protein AAF846_20600 [Chloroflexota bacterium]